MILIILDIFLALNAGLKTIIIDGQMGMNFVSVDVGTIKAFP